MNNWFQTINLESTSFWIGFIAASIFWWLVTRLAPSLKKFLASIRENFIAARASIQTGAEQRLRGSILKDVQSLHLASPLFSLDEIVVAPRVMAPPVMPVPGQEPPLETVANSIIPFMPDFPELSAALGGQTLGIFEVLSGGANIILTGKLGSGKTTALAYLASQASRRDPQLGDLQDHIPVYLHSCEILSLIDEAESILEPIIQALSSRPSVNPSRLPETLDQAFNNGRILLLLDGLDEFSKPAIQQISSYVGKLLDQYPQLRLVIAAAPEAVGGLQQYGLAPIPIASWSQRQQITFIKNWSKHWVQFVQPSTNGDENAIEPLLLNGWLLSKNASLSPLEFVLKVWSAYAGDMRGPHGTDAIEAYLLRMSLDISKVRPALEHLASQMVFTMQCSFTQKEAQKWTSGFDSGTVEGAGLAMVSGSDTSQDQPRDITIPRVISDLTRSGLLFSTGNRLLRFAHPVFAAYLAGSSFAQNGQHSVMFSQPDWTLKHAVVNYIAAKSNLSSETSDLLINLEDPLSTGVIITGNWLREIPLDAEWRKPILQQLANILQQDEIPLSFRARVLTCLAATNDPGVAAILRHLLRSTITNVRFLAALGSGFLRDTQAVDLLIQLLDESSPAGQAACLSLVQIGTKPAIQAAASVLLQGEETYRQAVSEAFAFNQAEGHPILKEGAEIDDLLVRRSVIYGLRLVNEPWALTILEEMQIEEGQWVVRNAAAQAVEELSALDPHIPKPLVPLQETPWLIEFASDRGEGLGSEEAAQRMLASAMREGNPEQRIAALQTYSRRGSSAIFPEIYRIVYGPDREIAEVAYDTIWQTAATGAEIPAPTQFGLGYN